MTHPAQAPDPEAVKRARAASEERLKTSDADLVEKYVQLLPQHVRALMAEALRPMFGALIQHERQRCGDILQIGVHYHAQRLREIEDNIQVAIARGQAVDGLAMERHAAQACATAVQTSAKAIAIPPGSCYRCGGARAVPSGILGPGGLQALVPCPRCAGPETAGGSPSGSPSGSNGSRPHGSG